MIAGQHGQAGPVGLSAGPINLTCDLFSASLSGIGLLVSLMHSAGRRGNLIARPAAFMPTVSLALFILCSLPAFADAWPRFRGPNGSGIGQAEIPAQWNDANRKWSVKLPGVGHGSPVVWGERVYLLCGNQSAG